MEKEKKKKKKSETGMHLYLNYCARYFVLLLTTVILQKKYIYIYCQGSEAVFCRITSPILNLFTLHNLCNNFIQGLRLGQAQDIICQLFMQRVILLGDFPKDDGV